MDIQNNKVTLKSFEIFYWTLGNPEHQKIFLVHGILEHSLRYLELAHFLQQNNFYLVALDLPGHGQSGGKKGDIEKFEDYSTICLELLKHLQISQTHLLGHSMGGLISYEMLQRSPKTFLKVILHNPALNIGGTLESLLIKLLKPKLPFLASIVPSLQLPVLIPAQKLVLDPEIQKSIKNDKLMIKWSTLRTLLSMAASSVKAHSNPLFSHPDLWLIQSLKDPVIDWEKNISYFKKYSQNIKTISWALHEPHNDKKRIEDYELIKSILI